MMMMMNINKELKKFIKDADVMVLRGNALVKPISKDEEHSKKVFYDLDDYIYLVDYRNHLRDLINLLPNDCEVKIFVEESKNAMQDRKGMITFSVRVEVRKDKKKFYSGILYTNTVDEGINPYSY